MSFPPWPAAVRFVPTGATPALGVAGCRRLAPVSAWPSRTTPLHGRIAAGDAAALVVGGLYLAGCPGFLLAGVGIAVDAPWWHAVLAASAAISLIVTVLDRDLALIGALLGAVVLAVTPGSPAVGPGIAIAAAARCIAIGANSLRVAQPVAQDARDLWAAPTGRTDHDR